MWKCIHGLKNKWGKEKKHTQVYAYIHMCPYIYETNHKVIHFILRNAALLGVQLLAMCFRAMCAFYIQQHSRVVDFFFLHL